MHLKNKKGRQVKKKAHWHRKMKYSYWSEDNLETTLDLLNFLHFLKAKALFKLCTQVLEQ